MDLSGCGRGNTTVSGRLYFVANAVATSTGTVPLCTACSPTQVDSDHAASTDGNESGLTPNVVKGLRGTPFETVAERDAHEVV